MDGFRIAARNIRNEAQTLLLNKFDDRDRIGRFQVRQPLLMIYGKTGDFTFTGHRFG